MTQHSVTVGIDVGDRHSYLCLLDTASGDVIEESRITTSPAAFERCFLGSEPRRVAVEAGNRSLWISKVLETISSLTARVREYDRELEALSRELYPETAFLRQVQGVGPLTALAFVLTVEDPSRFETSRSVGAYLGLVPGRYQSGESDPQQRISKRGDAMMRRLLVSCVHYVMGPFAQHSDLRRPGEKIAERGGKRASFIR